MALSAAVVPAIAAGGPSPPGRGPGFRRGLAWGLRGRSRTGRVVVDGQRCGVAGVGEQRLTLDPLTQRFVGRIHGHDETFGLELSGAQAEECGCAGAAQKEEQVALGFELRLVH